MSGSDAKAHSDTEDKEFVVVERPTARVVLPSADDHDDGSEYESAHEDVEENGEEDLLEDFPDDASELELVHQRISSLAPLRLQRFAGHLKCLCLRQNAVSFLDPEVFHQLQTLEELDLYDNKIKTVGNALDGLPLTTLDLSFNLLRSIPDALAHLQSLQTVYLVQNRISKITGLDASVSLISLELGGNRIRRIEGLDALVNLEELWLGKNKISKLENLDKLKGLKVLSLQSNRITNIENLESLENLEQLYLSHNGVTRIEGLENNKNLKTLDLGSNFVPAIENVSHLTSLEELWLNNNKIPDLSALEPQLGHLRSLETIYLEGNPCQQSENASYRRKIMMYLPQVNQIDATLAKPL